MLTQDMCTVVTSGASSPSGPLFSARSIGHAWSRSFLRNACVTSHGLVTHPGKDAMRQNCLCAGTVDADNLESANTGVRQTKLKGSCYA